MNSQDDHRAGLQYAPDVQGKFLFRIRQQLVRDSFGLLVTRGALGAVKLDLVLRGLALYEEHLGNRDAPPGFVLDRYTYEQLHDLARTPTYFRGRAGKRTLADADEAARKNEWVRQQLHALEELRLVRLDPPQRNNGRPRLVVLRDDASGEAFDDPGATVSENPADRYLTILGGVIAAGLLGRWDTPRLVAYICATIAEQHDADGRPVNVGSGHWWRSPRWFTDQAYRRHGNILMPFSETTIKRGLRALRRDGLLDVTSIDRNPRTGRRVKGGHRNRYTNRFRDGIEVAGSVETTTFTPVGDEADVAPGG
jgi:hypothetical protein